MAQNSQNIQVGAGRIFVGVTAPATGAPPSMTTHTDGVPGTGTEVGHTSGASTFTYTPKKNDIESEQVFGIVDTFVESESVSIKFKMQERNYTALKMALDAIGSVDDGAKTLFYAGGAYQVASQCVVLTSRRRTAPTKFEVLTIYKAQSVDAVAVPYGRAEVSMVEVTLRGVHDGSRNAVDQLWQWFIEK